MRDDYDDVANAADYFSTDRKIKIVREKDITITDKPTNNSVDFRKPASFIERKKTQSSRFTEIEGPTFIKTKRLFDLITDSGNQYQKSTFGFKPNPMTVSLLEHNNVIKAKKPSQNTEQTQSAIDVPDYERLPT